MACHGRGPQCQVVHAEALAWARRLCVVWRAALRDLKNFAGVMLLGGWNQRMTQAVEFRQPPSREEIQSVGPCVFQLSYNKNTHEGVITVLHISRPVCICVTITIIREQKRPHHPQKAKHCSPRPHPSPSSYTACPLSIMIAPSMSTENAVYWNCTEAFKPASHSA